MVAISAELIGVQHGSRPTQFLACTVAANRRSLGWVRQSASEGFAGLFGRPVPNAQAWADAAWPAAGEAGVEAEAGVEVEAPKAAAGAEAPKAAAARRPAPNAEARAAATKAKRRQTKGAKEAPKDEAGAEASKAEAPKDEAGAEEPQAKAGADAKAEAGTEAPNTEAEAAKAVAGVVATNAEARAEAPEVFALSVAPSLSHAPVCSKCKVPVDPLRAQLTGKSSGCWKCPKCNCRMVKLHRQFGGWPPEDFEDLMPEAQTDFWRTDANSPQELRKLVVDTLLKRRVESNVAARGGEFLPLSVYAARGFDVSAIERNCQETEQHIVFGKTYKVDIHSVCNRTLEEEVREKLLQKKSRPSCSSNQKVARSRSRSKGKTSRSRSSNKGKKSRGRNKGKKSRSRSSC